MKKTPTHYDLRELAWIRKPVEGPPGPLLPAGETSPIIAFALLRYGWALREILAWSQDAERLGDTTIPQRIAEKALGVTL